jgi:hypothetical protein
MLPSNNALTDDKFHRDAGTRTEPGRTAVPFRVQRPQPKRGAQCADRREGKAGFYLMVVGTSTLPRSIFFSQLRNSVATFPDCRLLCFQELTAASAPETGEAMSANELIRGNADRVISKGATHDLDHFATKQVITGKDARKFMNTIGVDLDKVSEAAENLKQAAARTALLPQKRSIRHSPPPIPRPLHCRGVRVLDLDPVM